MFDFRPFFVLCLPLENGVNHTFYKISSSTKPGLEKTLKRTRCGHQKDPNLLLVFSDSPEPLPMLPSRTRNDNRIADSHVEATSKDTIYRRDGMRDLVCFALSVAACNINKDTLVVLSRINLQRRSRDFGRNLINPV